MEKWEIIREENSKKSSKFLKRFIGRKIVDIAFDYWMVDCWDVDEEGVEIDGGDIYLLLDDGTVLKFWNSEWGGVKIVSKDKFQRAIKVSDYEVINDDS